FPHLHSFPTRRSSDLFYDSSYTDQVNIVVGTSSGDLKQALQQQASQLGMTGQKPGTPLSFAGTTWQQLQGNVQQKGASYTETLLDRKSTRLNSSHRTI